MNFGFLLLLSSMSCISACNFSFTIKQELIMNGFHRNLTYDITIDAVMPDLNMVWPYTDCFMSLYQPLPEGLYANPDELEDLSRCSKVYAQTQRTNVELPAHQAEPNVAIIFHKVKGSWVQVWLPVHARYHKASRFGGYVLNRIEPPQLYMRCPNNELEKCEKEMDSARFICENDTPKQCLWRKIPFIIITDIPVQWKTPVGNMDHYFPVVLITNMVITLGSIYLLLTINFTKFQMYDYDRIA